MTIAIAAATVLLALLAGVLLAALDVPHAQPDRHLRRLSLALMIGVSVTAATGVAYSLLA